MVADRSAHRRAYYAGPGKRFWVVPSTALGSPTSARVVRERMTLNGKRAAGEFFGRRVEYAPQRERVGRTAVFVLPSTSGAARGHWDEGYWQALARYIRGRSTPEGTPPRGT